MIPLRRPLLGEAVFPALLVLACILWTLYAGMDVSWDLWNYHIYGPLAFLRGRLEQDFMAASIQSYLNPVVNIPFYFMFVQQWHAVLIGLVLAVVHALALVFLFRLCRSPAFFPGPDGKPLAIVATLLGAATSIYWNQVGTSFTDVSTAILVVAAIWLFASARLQERPLLQAALVGGLLGLAAALKLTNAIYLAAGVALPAALPGSAAVRARALACFAAGALAGVAVGGGYWMWVMWQEFGNPVFPFFNGVFRSPDYPAINFFHDRFHPRTLGEALLAPFRMVLPMPRLYAEILAPDVRVAMLAAAAAALAAYRIAVRQPPSAAGVKVLAIGIFYALAFAAWLATTFNSRYGLPLLLLTGPLLVATLAALPIRRYLLPAAIGALALQLTAVYLGSAERWTPNPWSRYWIEVEMPERLRAERFVYLSIESQPRAALALYLHPASSLVNLRGQHALALDGPGGRRLERIISANKGRLRTLGWGFVDMRSGELSGEWRAAVDTIYAGYGLRVESRDCHVIGADRTQDAVSRAANWLGDFAPAETPVEHPLALSGVLLSCPLEFVGIDETYLRARKSVDALFDVIEKRCPRLFTPGIARSERVGTSWLRFYATTDRTLILDDGGLIHVKWPASMNGLVLGTPAAWEGSGDPGSSCER